MARIEKSVSLNDLRDIVANRCDKAHVNEITGWKLELRSALVHAGILTITKQNLPKITAALGQALQNQELYKKYAPMLGVRKEVVKILLRKLGVRPTPAPLRQMTSTTEDSKGATAIIIPETEAVTNTTSKKAPRKPDTRWRKIPRIPAPLPPNPPYTPPDDMHLIDTHGI